MTIDNLQRFIELQRALVEEKSTIESRLRTIDQALGNMAESITIPTANRISEASEPSSAPASKPGKRKMSAEGRKRIAEAQRLRRLKERGMDSPTPSKTATKAGRRQMSESARKAIASAARKRWAAAKASGKSRL